MVRFRAIRLDAASAAAPKSRRHPLTVTPDAELVLRAQAGEPWAEEALFRKHVDYIATLTLRLLRNPNETDDVVQETFVDAIVQIRKLSTPDAFRPWLTAIAVHKVHRRFRKQRLLALFGLHQPTHEAVLEACAPPSASPEIRAELALLDAVLARVPDVDRAAWQLRYVEGHSLDEVAGLCRCSLATAKRRITRVEAVVAAHVSIDGIRDATDRGDVDE